MNFRLPLKINVVPSRSRNKKFMLEYTVEQGSPNFSRNRPIKSDYENKY